MAFQAYGRRLRATGGSVLLTALLAGCGTLDTTKSDYRNAQPARPLDLPPELSAPEKDDRYTVSDVGSKGTSFSAYAAGRAAPGKVGNTTEPAKAADVVLLKSDKVRIERVGNMRYLALGVPPAEAWTALKRYVQSRGWPLKLESPELGLLETDWMARAAYVPQDGIQGKLAKFLGTSYSTSEKEKFRFRLEAGTSGGTEVFLSWRGVEEVYVTETRDLTRWQPKASDGEVEAEALTRLLAFLAGEEKTTTVLAAQAASDERAKLIDEGGKLAVQVEDRFDRAWRRVGLALDRNGFTVEDRDRTKGLYFVRYRDPLAEKAPEKSWWESLLFWKDDAPGGAGVVLSYRIQVVASGEERAQVAVQDKDGVQLGNAVARDILEVVRKELK